MPSPTIVGAVVLLWAASTAQAATEIDFGRYHALVVGINEYHHLPKLETAVNDASAVHDLLLHHYGFDSTLLLNPAMSWSAPSMPFGPSSPKRTTC